MTGKYDVLQVLAVVTVLALVATVSILWVMPVSAATGGGALKGEINGKPWSWQVPGPAGGVGSAATYSVISSPSVVQHRIQGYPGSDFSMKDSLSLSFTTMNGQLIGSPQVSYLPGKKLFPLYSNEGSGNLVIENEKNLDGQKQLQGRYQGTLVLVEKIGQTPDGKNAMEIDVHFDVLLHEVD